ncbi:flagellin lysine-N-methylase [Paenibacillus sp. sptzw28]|nr:flagellin lysine-N-methylase [Paenibacillus sp. sptzw28]
MTTLIPQYMNSFSCIGSACEDTCCAGWQVTIDKSTYKKYGRVRDKELSPLLNKKVKKKNVDVSPENYASMELDSKMQCSFLSEQNLCRIQQKLGESFLSHVCATYPRTSNLVNNILETSATMSCPEIARLALLNPNKMEFDMKEESIHIRNMVINRLQTDTEINDINKYFWELRSFSIDVLQNRTYYLWERLIILGVFYQKLEQYLQDGMLDEIPHLISMYMSNLGEGRLKEGLDKLPTQYTFQLKVIKEIIDKHFLHTINNQRYLECFNETLQGLQYSDDCEFDEISVHYDEAYNDYYLPFIKDHEYILENYLVNYVYKNLFPVARGNNLFEEYVMLIVHYSMIKMHLIGMAGFRKNEFKLEHVIKMIQSYSKTIEHNPSYLQAVIQLLNHNGINTMTHMAVLIKN